LKQVRRVHQPGHNQNKQEVEKDGALGDQKEALEEDEPGIRVEGRIE
jgi:hypothetical protein